MFIQDLKDRSVYWVCFPLLALSFVSLSYLQLHNAAALWQPVLINVGFVLLQVLLVSLYFSLKHKKFVNITHSLLGIGDILFLFSTAFYLSALNFLFFYIVSLIGSLIIWLIWQMLSSKKTKEIPLAGFQSIILMLFLAGSWWIHLFDLANDAWLLNLIGK